ncbi:hypothetical protein ACFWAP_00830 [Streptomyces goshikiensis]|uniref:hypothetical protein n=1 Tax=Streptomyces goshikiensis TaxID=1942 RepID=UPI003668F324
MRSTPMNWSETVMRPRSGAFKQCPNCKRRKVCSTPGGVHQPHDRADGKPCKFVVVYRTYYTTDDIGDGEIAGRSYQTREIIDCVPDWARDPEDNPVKLAIDAIRDADCAYDEGADWFYNHEGSYLRDNYTGERIEPSAHLYGFTAEEDAHLHMVVQRGWKQFWADLRRARLVTT